jgi:hypothetical protein
MASGAVLAVGNLAVSGHSIEVIFMKQVSCSETSILKVITL